MEEHNTAYGVVLPPDGGTQHPPWNSLVNNIEPRFDKASGSNCQFQENIEIDNCVIISPLAIPVMKYKKLKELVSSGGRYLQHLLSDTAGGLGATGESEWGQ